MLPTQELADIIARSRFERAMVMSPEEKFFAGGQLFEFACRVTLAGIRDQFPDFPMTKHLRFCVSD